MRTSKKYRGLNTVLRIHRMIPLSLTNGPGRRFVLWVQGCCFNCPGCFNPSARTLIGGEDISLKDIILHSDPANLEGVTISGGEPFLQAPELAILLKKFKEYGLNTMVYTGFNHENLVNNEVNGAKELLKYTDLLLDGAFSRFIPPDGEWTGSGNQGVIPLSRAGLKMKKLRKTAYVEQEYILGSSGRVIKTGI